MNTGAPGIAAWMAQTPESASAMPTVSEPAMVSGVVEPPCGMVTKPIGIAGLGKGQAGVERALVVTQRRDGAEQGRDRRRAPHGCVAAGDGARHLDRHAALASRRRSSRSARACRCWPARRRSHTGRGARRGGPGRSPSSSRSRSRRERRRCAYGDHVGGHGGSLEAALEIVDVGRAAVGGEQRAVAGDERAVGARAQRQALRAQARRGGARRRRGCTT